MSKGFGYKYSGTLGHIVGVANSLPKSPTVLLQNGWEDISHPNQKAAGHWELRESATGLRIRFDKGEANAPGFRGVDHYHIYNPNAESNKDLYLDKTGQPTNKSSSSSHVLPEGGHL